MSADPAHGTLDPKGSGEDAIEAVRRVQAYLDQLRSRGEPLPVEEAEWDRFLRLHGTSLARLVRSQHWSTEDCEDGIQELWLVLIARLPDFHYDPRRGELEGWISTVARHRLVDQGRYRNNRSMTSLDRDRAEQLISRERDPAVIFEQNQVIELVRDALAELQCQVTPRDYEAFTLHWLEGLSVREVARRLGRTETEIWSSDHRLSSRLRPMLERRLVPGAVH